MKFLKLSGVMLTLSLGIVTVCFAKGGSHQSHGGLQGSQAQNHETKAVASDNLSASEVEYVDGPLAPLYDFLIQRRLTRFCKLLRDAELDDYLLSLGSYWTLFVPTDASFFFLPGGTLENLKRNPQQLRDFILYHFILGDVPSSMIVNEMLIDSLQGSPLRFNIYGQIVTVSGAQIVESDLEYELGKIHIVDRPFYPIPNGDISSYLKTSNQGLYLLLLETNLLDYLNSGTFTVLAPDDDAFAILSAEFKDAMKVNTSLAERVLLNHILPGSLYIGGITDGMQWETVGGGTITFTTKRGLIFANDVPIVLPDLPFNNGVVHGINRVLLPEGVESDCHCKPSSNSPQRPALQTPSQTQRPQFIQGVQTTRTPIQPTFTRQTPRPFGGQPPPNVPGQRRTSTSQTTRPLVPRPPSQPPPRPLSPPPRRVPSPIPGQFQTPSTRTPFLQPEEQPYPEDDINTVIEPILQPGVQKRPDQIKTTRIPQPPRRVTPLPRITTPRHSSQNPRIPNVPPQQPSRQDNGNYPQPVTSPVIQPPQQTNRWNNNRQTQAPRYPTPFVNQPTTRRPISTWSYNRITQPIDDKLTDYTVPGSVVTTQSPYSVQQPQGPAVTSWQQRNQAVRTTRQPTQIRTTPRSSRVPSHQQRRPITPRPQNVPTPAAVTTVQTFDSNRQTPACRKQLDPITSINRNLPICQETSQNRCQNPPFNPTDSRPLCPSVENRNCRQPNDPFNPSDRRPLCQPTTPEQGCRNFGDPTYAGDRRPFCSPTTPNQVDCRDPSLPFSSTDSRPLCRTSVSNDINPVEDIPQGCRKSSEPASLQDLRPECPEDDQTNCRNFLERPQPGDRRPVCRTNGQSPTQRQPVPPRPPVQQRPPVQPRPPVQQRPPVPQRQSHVTKGQSGRLPQPRPSYQTNSPVSQTSRRQSWQTTTSSPQGPNQSINGERQNTGNVPKPPQPRAPGPLQVVPQVDSQNSQPGTPQSGSPPTRTQPNFQPGIQPNIQRPSNSQPTAPPRIQSRPYPTRPQVTQVNQRVTPVTQPPRSLSQTQGPYPTRPPFDVSQPPQQQTFQTSRPNVPPSSSNLNPPRSGQQIVPQTRPLSPPRQQTGPVTPFQRNTPVAPVSVTGTSTTPTEDSRRSLYEIVENPALLIQGQPVKLTKILDLFTKAGIVDVLTGQGPVTVFLPSDDAFAALPRGVIEQLEENPELLRQVLLYHISNVEILPTAQDDSYTVSSLEGKPLVITMLRSGRLILISGAKAIAVTRANNGIFYVINQLLYPIPHQDIFGAIQSRPDLSILAWLLSTSGVLELLQGGSPYTILAPTDNAFSQLPDAVYQEITQNTTAMQEILLNHIIRGAHYGREFFNGPTFPSARGGKLKFQIVSYGYQVNEVNIKTPEIVTGTGVIHLIDQVLLEEPDLKFFSQFDNAINGGETTPSGQQPNNALQPSIGQPGPNAPRPGVSQPIFDIQRIPSGQPQVTGLQPPFRQQTGQRNPTNRVPSVGPPNQNQGTRQPANQRVPSGQAPAIGQQHNQGQILFGGRNTQPQINNRPSQGGQRQPGQSQFSGLNQPAIQPQTLSSGSAGNVAELAKSMGLNRFANWITNAGLLEKVHDGGVYTVFAPTDEAVNALPQDMAQSIDTSPEQTKSLLQYHIVPQTVNLNSLTNDETSSTLLQDKKIRFNVYPGPHLNCKQVVTASGTPVGDALATMGSVQLIPVTQVLYQPTGNILKIIEASPILQSLSQAIRSAHVTWILSGNGPFTFFAPSDTAFESLPEEEKQVVLNDKQKFTELLKRHLVRGTYFSSGVQEDLEKKSDNNQPIKISLQEGIMTVNSIPVAFSDITATNGVLHVIDQFL